jgi:hypothetical protein
MYLGRFVVEANSMRTPKTCSAFATKAEMRKKSTQRRRIEEAYFGLHFDARRTNEAHGDTSVLLGNSVSLSVPSGSSHFDVLTLIAQKSTKPIPVRFLSEKLKELKPPRGRNCFGDTARGIEAIVSNYGSLRWWLTEQGLVVDEVLSELDSLSSFDRLVGPLSVQGVQNGILREEAVCLISEKLDEEGFKLKEHLQPKEWGAIVAHNRKRTGRQVESFAAAVKDPRFVRHVRRSIYRARDRYNKAVRLDSQLS